MKTLKVDQSGGTSIEDLMSSKSTINWSEDENKERGNWSGRLDFLLSCIGFAVGLGNVWRFPFLCYRNGGGAFLVPYVIMLGLAGLPLFFMELAIGQYASLGPTGVFKISPLFKGVGYAMITISGMVCIYYNVILCYVIFYFFASFASEVPWKRCGNWWNTERCTSSFGDVANGTDIEGITPTSGSIVETVTSLVAGNETLKRTSPAEEYWEHYVLRITEGIDVPGGINWQLCLCLLLAWLIVFVCLIRGIKSTGKVVYFTATFPYVVLLILLFRGATLPGAIDGIKFYIVPDFARLKDAKVWGDAAVQIFYSLGPAWGGLITMSSYNRFHNNCYRDAVIVAITNCGTSVFAGFVIFSVIGFMANELQLPVGEVVASGPGLAFVAYPEGIARMPGAPFWAILFFFMLITLGLDSMFTMSETVISALTDEFPKYLRPYKSFFTLVFCLTGFLLGLPQVTNGGIYWMNLMDWYSAGFSLLLVSLLEVIIIMYIYGYERFYGDIEAMIGHRPNIYWQVCWRFITPVVIVFIIVFNAVNFTPVSYNGVRYPAWADTLGWLMVAAALLWIPLYMLRLFIKTVDTPAYLGWYLRCPWTGQTLKELWSPTEDWGPALPEHRRRRDTGTQADPLPPKSDLDTSAHICYESHI